MDAVFTPNLDKLRNIVQSFGANSFTATQVATEYEGSTASSEVTKTFEELLAQHAAVLGIQSVPGHYLVWRAN
ncbi:hypothetical protein SR914_05325 [Comamonas testosteroni]|jgi:hypothetical protein|uniref:Uncharacterized protein n=1 Tax=Comamonas testosteroni (strain DSM 14576 / KF-1) TaxID=399795 RepID=B7WZ80_COMTK|nr:MULTISPECIES: hypothetical protein [Comamonas]EED69881.1 hypothetical protein CtesDRAFT_PD4829 [Comamonas testosteroni KF-1]TYK71665.1 hypothetical protein FSY59_11000 [Comamonas sp. Z3]WQG67824.1 hypothetical protein SR914_05325 [Comamonas testosteroni]